MNIRDKSIQNISHDTVVHRIMTEICSTIYHSDCCVYELIVRWQDSPIL